MNNYVKIASAKISYIFLTLLCIRLSANIFFYTFNTKVFGYKFWYSFLLTQIWITSELILIVYILALPSQKLLRFFSFFFLGLFSLILCIWTIADPIIFSLAGDRLTPSLLAHFGGFDIFTSNYLLEPIMQNLHLILPLLFLLFLTLYLIFRLFYSAYKEFIYYGKSKFLRIIFFSLSFVILAPVLARNYLYLPPEIEFLLDWVLQRKTLPDHQKVSLMRNFLDPNKNNNWIDEQYPLVCTPKSTPNIISNRPDIVIIVVESLRASDIKVFSQKEDSLNLPGLELFAKSSVIFPNFISAGFPSVEGFISLHAGSWPHFRKRTGISFQNTEFDGIASRLIALGYSPLVAGDKTDFDTEGIWLNYFYETRIVKNDMHYREDKIVSDAINRIQKHDLSSTKPLFLYLKTRNPHYPYTAPFSGSEAWEASKDTGKNYINALKFVDLQLFTLAKFLRNRKNWKNTVFFLTGDHANILYASSASALPTDDYVNTGAILGGGFISQTKQIIDLRPSSQPDIKATIIDILNDSRPRVCIGQSLIEPAQKYSYSIAIRPGGIRYGFNNGYKILDRRFSYTWQTENDGSEQENSNIQWSSESILEIVQSWSTLIEINRVWNKKFLNL